MAKADQPARSSNIAAIVGYFKSGEKPRAEKLGIELEHTLVKKDGSPVSYSEEGGVRRLLEKLMESYPQALLDAEGDLVGVASPGKAVTIEPAAQVELSAGPFTDLGDALSCFSDFEDQLAGILSSQEADVATVGYHPTAKAADLELIPKRRYDIMNRYLGGISPFGVCMMRGSASTQVSIDYTSERDCLRKLRTAFALVPLLSLICDNAPVFEGRKRTHELVRTEIWQHCDPGRCGTIPGVMDPGFTLEDYARYVLDTPAILVPDGCGKWRETSKAFGEEYADTPMGRSDVEHALSMFFTDVRLKTYLEIRPADALPVPYAIAYAALIKGLFYHEGNLDEMERMFASITADDIDAAKISLMESGYDGTMYGGPVAQLADTIISLARQGLSRDEQGFLEPLAALVAARETLAKRAEKASGIGA